MSSSLVVSNAGPLITLAKINRFDLLKELFGSVFIPQAVFDEVVRRGSGEPGAMETNDAEWVETRLARDDLRKTDFRASTRVYEEVLAKAGEA